MAKSFNNSETKKLWTAQASEKSLKTICINCVNFDRVLNGIKIMGSKCSKQIRQDYDMIGVKMKE